MPQSIQSRTEFIDQSQIFYLDAAKGVIYARKLMTECLQSNPKITQSVKGQQRLPSSLIHECKSFNTAEHLYSSSLSPSMAKKTLISVLIGFLYLFIRSHLLIFI